MLGHRSDLMGLGHRHPHPPPRHLLGRRTGLNSLEGLECQGGLLQFWTRSIAPSNPTHPRTRAGGVTTPRTLPYAPVAASVFSVVASSSAISAQSSPEKSPGSNETSASRNCEASWRTPSTGHLPRPQTGLSRATHARLSRRTSIMTRGCDTNDQLTAPAQAVMGQFDSAGTIQSGSGSVTNRRA